jgi:hypothetical protein
VLGLKATADVVPRGGWGVTFLSRNYTPAVWYGAVDSYCDIKRILSKFHAAKATVPIDVMVYSRYVTNSRSDALTPVISSIVEVYARYVDKYLDLPLMERACIDVIGYWTARFRDVDYIDWPQTETAAEYSEEYLERELPGCDLEGLRHWREATLTRIEAGGDDALACLRSHPLLLAPSEPVDVHEHGYVEITPDNNHWLVCEPLRFAFPRETNDRRKANGLIQMAVEDVVREIKNTGGKRHLWYPPPDIG